MSLSHLQSQDFKPHIVFLASDSLHGRAPGTADEVKAANYIASQFYSVGNEVVLQKFAFEKDSAINVFGFLDFKKDSTIIISAHYDHLGYGGSKSKEIFSKGIHHGADDNGSGVALMIELARGLFIQNSTFDTHHYNYLFAAYSAHEAGLHGSVYFAKSRLCDSLKIRAVVNLDMVGRLDTTSKILRISGAQTDMEFYTFFHQQEDSLLHFRLDDENLLFSDLKPFAERGTPVLHITTGIHNDYHRIADTEEKINYAGLHSIYFLLRKLLKVF